MPGRLAAIVVSLAMAALTVKAATQGDGRLAWMCAAATAAFASNLVRRLNPVLRMMALALQVLALLVTGFVALFAFSYSEGGSSAAGFGALVMAAFVAGCFALNEGRRAIRTH